MTLEGEFQQAGRSMLAQHLDTEGLRASVGPDGVKTGIGRVSVDIKIEGIDPVDDGIRMTYWAMIEGIDGLSRSPITLDLMGTGADAQEALRNGVHVLVDQVLPAIRFDHERQPRDDGVAVGQVTSLSGGRGTSWDLIMGPPGIRSDHREDVAKVVKDLLLFQGILDTLMPVLHEVRPHWYKLFIVHAEGKPLFGDVKVDGIQVGIAPSFDSPNWPPGVTLIRQFGLIRPTSRVPDRAELAPILDAFPASSPPRRLGWLRRLGRTSTRRFEPARG